MALPNEPMIDIHAHILPDVDDGSPDMEDSILMAELAVESGVDTIIATPHGNLTEGSGPEAEEEEREHTRDVKWAFEAFTQELKKRGIPLRVLQGMEIYATADTPWMLEEGILLPMIKWPHCLIEFGFQDSARLCTRRIEQLADDGWQVIIAHPERYTCIQRNLSLAEEWIDLGARLQANKGSILGGFGRGPHRAAWEMLDRNLIAYIGSDAHSPYERTTYMKDVYDVISDAYSVRMADALLGGNAARDLLGE